MLLVQESFIFLFCFAAMERCDESGVHLPSCNLGRDPNMVVVWYFLQQISFRCDRHHSGGATPLCTLINRHVLSHRMSSNISQRTGMILVQIGIHYWYRTGQVNSTDLVLYEPLLIKGGSNA